MSDKRVVVEGGGKNLFYVEESGDTFNVSQIDVGVINYRNSIGKTDTLESALALIKANTGKI